MHPTTHVRRTLAAAALAALVAGSAAAAPQAASTGGQEPAQKVDQLHFPPLRSFTAPKPQRVVLDNGMVVMLLEDHELPLVDATALIHTGSRLEPADQVGLAGLTGDVLRSGGTEAMSPEELNEYLENKAASIESSIGATFGSASMSALAKDFPEVLKVFADVLRRPRFEEDKLEVAKTQVIASIARQNDNPQSILFRELNQVVYGEGSPYARQPTYATVGNVGRDDLVAWHDRYYHPDRIVLGLVGDFDSKRALALVKQAFGDWPKGPAVDTAEATYDTQPSPGVYFAKKTDVTQSNIGIGHLGIEKDNPDYYAVEVLNNVLSGGFGSRLFSNVRSKKGLAYGVFGAVGSNYDYPGLFQLFTSTKIETTGAAIEALLEEADRLTSDPPTAEEVDKARQSILNSFVFETDSTREILDQQLRYEYFGYPLDWLERYQKGIEAATVDQVRAAAAKYVHPDRFAIVVVGPSEETDMPLAKFGEVSELDISIPEAPVERAAVTEEGQAQARQLLDKAVAAMGGAERVDAVESLTVHANASQTTPQGEMQVEVATTQLFPDRYRQELTLPFGTMSMVLTGDTGFAVTPRGVMDLPGSQLAALRSNAMRDPLALLKRRDDPELVATALPPGDLDDTPLERLQIELAGDVTVLGLDPESGEIRTVSFRGTGPAGNPGEEVVSYSDYRDVGGLRYPFAVAGTFDGEAVYSATVTGVEVDREIPEEEFQKPE